MTDNQKKPNTGNEAHVTNPKPPGHVERVNENGEPTGTIDTTQPAKR